MNNPGVACLFSLTLLFAATVHAQTSAAKPPDFDHLALHVQDLARSGDFYEKVVGLERIPDPFKDGRHIWFRMGPHSQLHVISGATGPSPAPIDVHFALRVASLADFTARLDTAGVKYRSFLGDGKITSRPDGVKQTYLQDPDGYWIEVNDGTF